MFVFSHSLDQMTFEIWNNRASIILLFRILPTLNIFHFYNFFFKHTKKSVWKIFHTELSLLLVQQFDIF